MEVSQGELTPPLASLKPHDRPTAFSTVATGLHLSLLRNSESAHNAGFDIISDIPFYHVRSLFGMGGGWQRG